MEPDYTLIRSRKRKKTMAIMVNREGRVVVRVPHEVPLSEINAFVQQKRAWLSQKITAFKTGSIPPVPDLFLPGKQVLFLGDTYPLCMDRHMDEHAKDALYWNGDAFRVVCREPAAGKNLLTRWYVRQAKAFFPERLAQHADRMGVSPKKVRVSSARFRWGSCSTRQCISLSWRLMMAPVAVIDSVMIHELVHLREMNHSSRFWSFVRTHCPEYDRHKRWLNTEGRYLMEF